MAAPAGPSQAKGALPRCHLDGRLPPEHSRGRLCHIYCAVAGDISLVVTGDSGGGYPMCGASPPRLRGDVRRCCSCRPLQPVRLST